MITLLFTDGSMTPIGQPIARFTSVVATLKFNEPASVLVTVPALADYIEMAQPGNRMVVIRDGSVLVEGPIEYPGAFSWSAGSGNDNSEPGQLLIASTSDSIWLERRLVYPDPAHASTAQTAAFYTLSATNAETAMRNLVNLNAGPGALVARRVPNYALGSLASVGTSINVRERFSVVGDALRTAALAGGGLGFDVVHSGSALNFIVFDPADLSGSVFFGRSFGSVRNIDYTSQAPGADVAIVGGDGTGSTRTIVERSDSGAVSTWGRREMFVNNGSSNTTDLNQAGDQALTDAAEQGQLSVQVIDTNLVRFGVDYHLGDLVSAEIYPGLVISDVVRQVVVTATKDGEVVVPQIGTASATADRKATRKLRELERRLGVLERT